MRRASRGYVSGETLDDALRTAGELHGRGYRATLAYWDAPGDDPAQVMAAHVRAAEQLAGRGLSGYLSIKAPSFGFDRALYRMLLERARALEVPLHFDSLGYETVDETFTLVDEHTAPPRRDVGVTLPGRWKRSAADAARSVGLGVSVRVVKGQWPDPLEPDGDMRRGFLSVVEALAGDCRLVRVATHDAELAGSAIGLLREAGTRCELELLYGLPTRQVVPIARSLDVPVRVYVPFGHGWLPYAMSNLRRPRVLWWLCRDAVRGPYLNRLP
jgi:proline dehydrogenase